jgi:hypothetical protein
MDAVGRKSAIAFAAATATLGGFVRAGVAGTTMGELLSLRMEMLSRQIGSLFVPELQAASDAIGRAVDWFRALSGEQQRNIARWIEGGLAALATATILPKVFAGITLVVTGLKSLTAAWLGVGAATGGLLPLLGAVLSGLAALTVGSEAGRKGFMGLFDVVRPLLVAIGRIIGELADGLRPVMAELVALGKDFGSSLVEGLTAAIPLAAKLAQVLGEVLATLARFREFTLFNQLRGFFNFGIALMEESAKALRGEQVDAERLNILNFLKRREAAATPPKPGQPGRDDLIPSRSGFESIDATFKRIQLASLKADLGAKGKSVEEQQLEVQRMQLAEQQKTNERLGGIKPAVSF